MGEGNIQNLEDPEASGMESALGNWLPISQGAGDSPFPGRGLPWSTSRQAQCPALREVAHPPPGRTSSSPPPARICPTFQRRRGVSFIFCIHLVDETIKP